MRYTKTITAAGFAAILAACGGGGSGGNNSADELPGYTITAYDIAGTSADESGQAPIDANDSGGDFVASWSVIDGNGYSAQLFVSENETFSSADVEFFDRFCTSADCGVSDSFADDCTFGTDNSIQCASDTGDAADLTAFLDTLPKDAFILMRSCDASQINCDIEAHAVQFR